MKKIITQTEKENSMSQEWYYTQNGERQGPVSPKQLKQLVTKGEIQPTDLVWTEGKDEWIPASSIKGLFQAKKRSKVKNSPPTIPTQSNKNSDQPSFFSRMITKFTNLKTPQKIAVCCIGTMGIFFFLCIGLCGIGTIGLNAEKREVAMKIDEANTLWDQGEKGKAIVLYKEVSRKDPMYMPENQRPVLFGRLLDHAAESGNDTEMRRLINRAKGFTPDCKSDVAKRFVAQMEAEKKDEEAKKESEQKVYKALSQVVTLSESDMVDFLDNTKNYKGKVIRMTLTMPSGFLRSGGSIAFYDFVGTSKLDVRINVAPSSVDTLAEFNSLDDLPNAKLYSKLEVTFLCEEGSLGYGNRAIRIERP